MRYRHFDLIEAAFVAVLLASNIASSAKIVDWGVSLGPIRLAFDAGTLLFPLSYIFGDILTEVYGYGGARRVIWTGFAASLLLSGTLWLVGVLPGEALWSESVGDQAFRGVLGGISTGAIVLASMVGYLLGEFSNSFVLAKMKVWTEGRWLWTRTIGSTLIGQVADTAGFVLVATALGVFPWEIFWSLVLANYIFKVFIEAVFTPVTYAIVGFLKKSEGIDVFDRNVSFSPLKF